MFNIIGITIDIYLFFILMGWGITRLILPASTSPYQFWLAPWFGLIVTDISAVWLSRLGLGTNESVYLVTLLGVVLLVFCKFCKVPLSVPWKKFDGILALGSLIALFLALAPLFPENPFPTTISLENADPPFYAIVADFLKSHSIKQSPLFDPEHPSNDLIRKMLYPGNRTGCWLVFGLIASRFNLQTYQIFTITLGVFFALTPPLITIFTWVVTKRPFAALLSLTISVFNVNLLFFNYHGFAAQILAQGCLILAYLCFYLAEREDERFHYYLLALGLSISSLFTLYPEITIFLFVPLTFYCLLKIINTKNKALKKIALIKNILITFIVTTLIDPYGIWHGTKYLLAASTQNDVNMRIPRWAFPVDMIGFISIHSHKNYSIYLLLIASVLVTGLIILGLFNLGNKTFFLSIFTFSLAILLWFRVIREYPYAYYKATGFLLFAVIITFSVGLGSVVVWCSSKLGEISLQFITLWMVVIFSIIAILPMFQQMMATPFRVTPELVSLSEVPIIAKKRKIYIGTYDTWQQLWASIFLNKSRMAFLNLDPHNHPLNSEIEKDSLLLVPASDWENQFFINKKDKLIWKNDRYVIATTEEHRVTIKAGKNWWPLEKWWGKGNKTKTFRWMNQDATIEIKNKESSYLKVALNLNFFPIMSKTTLDMYLNGDIIKTLNINPGLNLYSVSCKLRPGENQILFHIREGTVTVPGDPRKIALGVNGIALGINGIPFATIKPQ